MIKYDIRADKYGNVYYRLNNKLHRENGPAVICISGTQYWYKNGDFHRENGPAVICPNVAEYWFLNGSRHRTDGPATIYSNGHKEWWLRGKIYGEGCKFTDESWNKFVKTLIFS